MTESWRGIFSILITPFTDELELDETGLRRQVDFCVDAGAAGVVGVPPVMPEASACTMRQDCGLVGKSLAGPANCAVAYTGEGTLRQHSGTGIRLGMTFKL